MLRINFKDVHSNNFDKWNYERNLRMLEKHQQRNDAKNERASSVTSAS